MNRYNFIFFVIFITFLLPGPPVSPIASDEQHTKLSLFKSELYNSYYHLSNSTFNENNRNLTGYKLSYEDAVNGYVNQTYPIPGKDYDHWFNDQSYSILPDEITEKAKSIWDLEQNDPISNSLNYYTNISSSLKGEFQLINTSFVELPLQIPNYLENFNEDFNLQPDLTSPINSKIGNITDISGNINVDITPINFINNKYFNDLDSKIKLINIDFEISNDDESNKQTIETKGFYFIETGNIITTTNSAKFLSFYGGLQHLTFNKENYDLSKNLSLNYFDNTFFQTLDPDFNLEINFNYLTQFLEKSINHCEYISYFHLNKVNLSKNEISNIDKELQKPIGRPIDFNDIPGLNLTGLLYSPDCSIQLEIPTVYGLKTEILIFKYHKIVIIGILLLFAQIILIMKQMNYSNTPSTISRISFWSICLMSLVDGSLAMLYLVGSAILNKLYLPLTVSAFLSFILASIFEMRFMISIFTSQLNERNLNIFTALQGRPLDEDSNENSTTTLPNDLTTNDPPDEAQVSGTIYSRFFFFLIIFTFVTLNSIMWPKHIRKSFEYITLFVLNSYWLPQVYRNVIKGSHRSFKRWFIFGTTFIRTLPIFYVFVIKSNVFQHHYDLNYFLILVSWLLFQIFLLFLQEVFGARFFLPKKWLPQTYNYHPVLSESDLENGFGIERDHDHEDVQLNITDSQAQTIKNLSNGHCSVDCAICMNEVELPILKSNLDHASTFLLRRNYMVTPCRHIFHTQCLEAWMKYKLQCPVCRNSLPPL